MSVTANDRYEKTTATTGQTVFNYDWAVPNSNPKQIKVIQFVAATKEKKILNFGSDYTVDVASQKVTLTTGAANGDTIVIYSGTPETRETDFTGTTVSVSAANEAIDNLTYQTQQLARDVKRCLRVDMVEGIMPTELPSIDDRKNKYASWDENGSLTYDDPVTGILNDYTRKDKNLSDIVSVETARENLGLGNSATKNIGTTADTVCAGDDSRFLSQAQKDALTKGGNANSLHTHSGYVSTTEKGVSNGIATLGESGKLPNEQLPNDSVTSIASSTTENEVVIFNGVNGKQIKRSNKTIPSGNIVGSSDNQTLTNKTIDADHNTVSNIEADNLKAGVFNTDLNGNPEETQIPSAKATKDYADKKVGTLHNLGGGVKVGHDITNGRLSMRTLVAQNGIEIIENENDIYFYGVPTDANLPVFSKKGDGANWYKDRKGATFEYRSFTGSNGVTVEERSEEINASLTNIKAQGDMIVGNATGQASTLAKGTDKQVLQMDGNDPKWKTLGTMADQDANNINITGGTISRLNNALSIDNGGTGTTTKAEAFDALSPLENQGDILTHNGTHNIRLGLGDVGKVLKVNAGRTGVEWGDGYVTPTTRQGDLIVRGAANDTRLGIGTANQVLSVNTAGTDPEWKTLGTMSMQNASNVAITGGTISSLSTPLTVANGGTGLNTFGNPNYSLAVNGNGNGLTWNLNDRIDSAHYNIDANSDLNTLRAPGTYCCQSGTTTATLANKPDDMRNSAFLMIVRYITANYWQQEIINNEDKRWSRQYQISGATWSDWIPVIANACFHINKTTAQATLAYGTITTIQFNKALMDPFNGFDATTYSYTIPLQGYWFLYSQLMFNIGGSAGQRTSVCIVVDGGTRLSSIVSAPAKSGNQTISCCGIANLNKGDVVSIASYGYSNYNTLDIAGYGNYFGGFYLGNY